MNFQNILLYGTTPYTQGKKEELRENILLILKKTFQSPLTIARTTESDPLPPSRRATDHAPDGDNDRPVPAGSKYFSSFVLNIFQ